MTSQMIVRIHPDLKAKVRHCAQAEGKSVSAVVRELLEDYVKNRDIDAYIDDLWERIGTKLASGGFDSEDVDKAIRDARRKN